METLSYLLKVNLYWVLFYIVYWFFFRKNTFFALNRFYLIGALIVSFVIPLIELPETVISIPVSTETLSYNADLQTDLPIVTVGFSWIKLVPVLYLAGALSLLFRLLRGFYHLYLLVRQGESLKFDDYTLVLLPPSLSKSTSFGSCSFFKWLVVSDNDYQHHLETILQHEFVHIKQWHSLDILLLEILKAAFWFNPVFWFYKSSIREVHEFLADERADNRDSYATFLVSYARNACVKSITNHFFNSSILKHRIHMIYQSRTPKWLLVKYMMLMPVIAASISLTAARKHPILSIKKEIGALKPEIVTLKTKEEPVDSKSKKNIMFGASEATDVMPNLEPKKHKGKQNFGFRRNVSVQREQDTLKEEKRMYFTNYRVIPVKMNEVKPFLSSFENSTEFSKGFENPLIKNLPKSNFNNSVKGGFYNEPMLAPIEFKKVVSPENQKSD